MVWFHLCGGSYARYKVLSGFVNGVLLLYIAFFVFVEAIEVWAAVEAG